MKVFAVLENHESALQAIFTTADLAAAYIHSLGTEALHFDERNWYFVQEVELDSWNPMKSWIDDLPIA